MLEAYAAPEIVQTEPKTEMQAESDQDDDESTRKRSTTTVVPASPAMQALVDFVWPSGLRITLFSRHAEHTTSSSCQTCLSNIVNAELTDPEVEGVTITRDAVRLSLLSRYRPQVFPNKRFLVVVDGLVGCGMLHQVKAMRARQYQTAKGRPRPSIAR